VHLSEAPRISWTEAEQWLHGQDITLHTVALCVRVCVSESGFLTASSWQQHMELSSFAWHGDNILTVGHTLCFKEAGHCEMNN